MPIYWSLLLWLLVVHQNGVHVDAVIWLALAVLMLLKVVANAVEIIKEGKK